MIPMVARVQPSRDRTPLLIASRGFIKGFDSKFDKVRWARAPSGECKVTGAILLRGSERNVWSSEIPFLFLWPL